MTERSKSFESSLEVNAKSHSVEKDMFLKKRKLPDDDIEYLDPIWLFDDSSGKPFLRDVKDQPWFHGCRDKSDLQILLREKGDWLVKPVQDEHSTDVIIVVRVTKKILAYYPLAASDEKFWFLSSAKREKCLRYFLNQVDLIEYYKERKLPGNYIMKNFICRPCWLIKNSDLDYNLEDDLIGQGFFSSVYSARYRMADKQSIPVAVKEYRNSIEDRKIYKEKFKDFVTESKFFSYLVHTNLLQFYGILENFVTESKFFSYLVHTNLLQFYGILESDSKIRILEFCPGGSLSSHLKRDKEITMEELYLYCYEISRGMEYLHRKNCIHKNLQCKNVLVSTQGSLKIGDYEFSILPYRNFSKITSFMAPEILKKSPSYSQKSDIWAMAVVIHEIFCNGFIPFQNEKEETIKNMIIKGHLWEIPQKIPKQLYSVIKIMLHKEPNERPSFKYLKRLFVDKIVSSRKTFAPEKLTLNKLRGVRREKFYIKYGNRDHSDRKSSSSSDDVFRKDLIN
uniref:Tyrosine-protein kinase n=1 Tax=Parastrongyloides trichosuri TaxID=131310 RepID=A0A0N4ZXC1_PARTI